MDKYYIAAMNTYGVLWCKQLFNGNNGNNGNNVWMYDYW